MSGSHEPVMSRRRGALAAFVVAAVLLGCVTGLGRYLSEREHQGMQLEALAEKASTLAALDLNEAKVSAEALIAGGAHSVDVMLAGRVDDFGIERGAEHVVKLRHSSALPGDAVDETSLQTRMAALGANAKASSVDLRLRFEALQSARGDGVVLAAYSPILDATGAVKGVVRLAFPDTAGDDPIPWWLLVAGLLLAAGAGALCATVPPRRRALLGGIAIAALAAVLGMGRELNFGLLSALVVFPLAWGAFAPVADLIRGLREQPGTYLYVLPAVLATVVLVFIPFSMGVVLAFFDAHGAPVGLSNFREILVTTETSDTNFWWTLMMTVIWTVTNISLHVSIGLALALVLNRPKLELKWLYRVLLIVPWAVPNYITALIWKGMFNEHEGAVNAALALFGVGAIDWFGTSVVTNFSANLVTNVWLGFPFMMVVCLGALQAIPRELYEAATIDGAGRLQAFRHVTLPLLKPALVPAVIVGTIWTFNMFNVIYLVSGGGPDGQTDILITEAYNAFKVLKRYGLAAAYSLLIFVILYAYGAMTNRVTRATEGAFE